MVSEIAVVTGRELRPPAKREMGVGSSWVQLDHRRIGAISACLALASLAACSVPFETKNPEAVDPESGERLDNLISFCYGTRINDPEEIKAAAEENCDGRLVFVEQDFFFNECPLLQNARVTYQCQPLARDEASATGSFSPR